MPRRHWNTDLQHHKSVAESSPSRDLDAVSNEHFFSFPKVVLSRSPCAHADDTMSDEEKYSSAQEDFPQSSPKRRRLNRSPASSTHEHLDPEIKEELPTPTLANGEVSLPFIPNVDDVSHLQPPHLPTHDSSQPSTPYSTDVDPASSPIPNPSLPPPAHQSPDFHYSRSLTLYGHNLAVSAVAYSPNGALIASASADATLKIWDATSGRCLHTLRGHLAGISALAWCPCTSSNSIPGTRSESYVLASASDDKNVRLWRVTAGAAKPHTTALVGHHNYVLSIAFSPKGNILASGSTDEAVILWDVRTCRALRVLPAHGDPVYGVDFAHDGTLVVSCAGDGLVRIWDTGTGQCLRTFFHEEVGGGRPAVFGVRFTPNARYVAAWMGDDAVRLWDYVGGRDAGAGSRCVKTYQDQHFHIGKFALGGGFGIYEDDSAMGVADHIDDEPLLDGTADGVEDVERRVERLEDEQRREEDRARRRKKAFLVSGSEDGSIVFWDVVTKEVMQRLEPDEMEGRRGHKGVVFGVDVHPQRGEVVSCGADGTVKIWKADEVDPSSWRVV